MKKTCSSSMVPKDTIEAGAGDEVTGSHQRAVETPSLVPLRRPLDCLPLVDDQVRNDAWLRVHDRPAGSGVRGAETPPRGTLASACAGKHVSAAPKWSDRCPGIDENKLLKSHRPFENLPSLDILQDVQDGFAWAFLSAIRICVRMKSRSSE